MNRTKRNKTKEKKLKSKWIHMIIIIAHCNTPSYTVHSQCTFQWNDALFLVNYFSFFFMYFAPSVFLSLFFCSLQIKMSIEWNLFAITLSYDNLRQRLNGFVFNKQIFNYRSRFFYSFISFFAVWHDQRLCWKKVFVASRINEVKEISHDVYEYTHSFCVNMALKRRNNYFFFSDQKRKKMF